MSSFYVLSVRAQISLPILENLVARLHPPFHMRTVVNPQVHLGLQKYPYIHTVYPFEKKKVKVLNSTAEEAIQNLSF